MSDAWQLEGSTDRWLLEDGTGVWQLEAGASARFGHRMGRHRHRPTSKPVPHRPRHVRRRPLYGTAFTPTTPTFYPAVSTSAAARTPRWRVKIVDFDYQAHGELVSASVDAWSDTLDGLSEVRVSFSGSDPAVSEFQAGTRWIEVWLDGDIKFRGYPVRASYNFDRQAYTVQCFDQLWPFTQRVFGRADVPNLLVNGGFESGTGNWTTAGSVTFTVDTSIVNEGTQSGKLAGSGRISQTISGGIRHTYPPGLTYRLALDVYEYATSASPAGTVVGTLRITDPDTSQVYSASCRLTDQKGGWQSLTADLFVSKANTTYTATVTLYGNVVGRNFDRVRVVRNEATTLDFPGQDQAIAYQRVVQYGQDGSQGQSTLGIGTNCPATGQTIMVGWPHADHRGLMSAIDELTQRPAGADWSLVYLPAATTFTTYYPKGSTHDEWLLEVGRNIVGGSVEVDVAQVKTSGIVIGEDSSFSRDEGGYVDTSQMSGLVLTDVFRAAPGTPTRHLDQLATERVDARKQLVAIPRVTVMDPDRELIHGIEVGDTLPVRLDIGMTQIDGRAYYRVVAKTVPASADRLSLDLVPVPA